MSQTHQIKIHRTKIYQINIKQTLLATLWSCFLSCGTDGINADSGTSVPKRTPGGDTSPNDPDNGYQPPASKETTFDLAICGFDVNKPSTVTMSQRLSMNSIKKTVDTSLLGGLWPSKTEVTFSGSIVIEGSMSNQVVTSAASAAPNLDKSEVTSTVSNLSIGSEATMVEVADRAKIGQNFADWKGLFCTLQPATKLASNVGRRVVVEFSQPIPFGVVAASGLERIKLELAAKRSFNQVNAKVIESNDKNLGVGSIFPGTVTTKSLAPTSIPGINADFGVSITYDFGSPEKNALLGLPNTAIWFVDSSTKKITGVQMQTKSETPVIYK